MNLNLDDRLADDAVELLERAMAQHDAALVGGEWNITYSQKETDAIERAYPAEFLPSIADWEQRGPGTRTRLGSGTGEQGTYGPATIVAARRAYRRTALSLAFPGRHGDPLRRRCSLVAYPGQPSQEAAGPPADRHRQLPLPSPGTGRSIGPGPTTNWL